MRRIGLGSGRWYTRLHAAKHGVQREADVHAQEVIWGLLARVFAVPGAFACRSRGAFSEGYLEAFTTTRCCDGLNTAVLRDNAEGEIRLPQFQLVLAGNCRFPRRPEGSAHGIAIGGRYSYVAAHYRRIVRFRDQRSSCNWGPFRGGWKHEGRAQDGERRGERKRRIAVGPASHSKIAVMEGGGRL